MEKIIIGCVLLIPAIACAVAVYIYSHRQAVEYKNMQAARAALLADPKAGNGKEPSVLKLFLVRAGIEMAPVQFVFSIAFLMASSAIAGYLVSGAAAALAVPAVIAACIIMAIKSRTKKRTILFGRQLGYCLPMVAENIRAGLSFERALSQVAEFMDDPIKTQFQRVSIERSCGLSLAAALENLADRVPCPDLPLLVAVAAINNDAGGSLSDTLDTIAATIDDRNALRDDIKVQTSAPRLAAAIVGTMPFIVLAWENLVTPAQTALLFKPGIGLAVLLCAVGMDISGLLIMRRMYQMKID
jgi:tight adherence protein B